jgi:Trypsin-like peptidase domain/TPR repeat/Tetratricopeptide repeat
MDILRMKYEKGEINKQGFEEEKKDVGYPQYLGGKGMIPFRFLALWIIFLYFILAAIPCRAQESFSAILKRIEPSIVTVLAYDKEGRAINKGGGVFVSKNGAVITNRGVLDGADRAEVKTMDGMLYPVGKVLGEDRVTHLVRIGVEIPHGQASPLLLSASPPQLGERIAVIGNPAGPEKSSSHGTVSALQEIPAIGRMVRVTAPIASSLNGCPVVNMKGEVIGIVTSWRVEGKDFNFVVPSERVAGLKVNKEISLAEWEGRKEETAESLYAKGLPFLWKEDYDKAASYFKKAVKIDPRYANAYFFIGYCNAQLERYPDALEAYKKAIQIQPDFVLAHFSLGLIYLDTRDRDHALAEYRILRDLDRNYADDLLNMIR